MRAWFKSKFLKLHRALIDFLGAIDMVIPMSYQLADWKLGKLGDRRNVFPRGNFPLCPNSLLVVNFCPFVV
jgi:hypothetical protein